MDRDQLMERLRALRLTGMQATLEQRMIETREQDYTQPEFLGLMLQDELQERQAKTLAKRLIQAKFEEEKTFEALRLNLYPDKTQRLLRELITGQYLKDHHHVLILGPTGTGKSHLAQALGHQACRLGRKVRFMRASNLLRVLNASRADQTWEKVFKQLVVVDLLIIDDFGLKSLTATQAEDVYELIAERHLKGSFIFTSNRKIEGWLELFPDPVMGNAALDRLSHLAYHVVLEGASYRKNMGPTHKGLDLNGGEIVG